MTHPSLFDAPPKEVSTKAQNGRILRHLQTIGPLTGLEAWKLYDCARLAGRIAELRAKGYRIDSPLVTLPNGKRIASYRLFP